MTGRSLRNHATERLRRRELLAAAGAAGAAALVGRTSAGGEAVDGQPTPAHVRIYPGPVPPWIWLRYGPTGVQNGWPAPFRAAVDGVTAAFETISDHAAADGIELEATIERGDPVPSSSLDVPQFAPDRQGVLDAFRDAMHERDVVTGGTCHLLCWWGPTHPRVGYGGVRSGTGHVASADDEGSFAVVNVGATEVWDSRAVTVNMAIHEVLHAYLTSRETEPLVGTGCDHDLGTAVRSGDTLTVSPMATAYATDGIGTGTRWPGSGCANHDHFAHHDGTNGVTAVTYTPEPSVATREGVTRYLERTMV